MINLQQYDFDGMQKRAIKQAKEMNQRAIKEAPCESFCSKACPLKNILSIFNINFDDDILLLLCLLLILSGDSGDKILIFAIIYIMT